MKTAKINLTNNTILASLDLEVDVGPASVPAVSTSTSKIEFLSFSDRARLAEDYFFLSKGGPRQEAPAIQDNFITAPIDNLNKNFSLVVGNSLLPKKEFIQIQKDRQFGLINNPNIELSTLSDKKFITLTDNLDFSDSVVELDDSIEASIRKNEFKKVSFKTGIKVRGKG